MQVLVSGGSKSGKSAYAQSLAKQLQNNSKLYYIATMLPSDNEDNKRIERHICDRAGWGFITIEQFYEIEEIIGKIELPAVVLVDSVTALLANEMFKNGGYFENAAQKIIIGLDRVMDAVSNLVIVSDYIYSDAYYFDEYTENYRKSLADIDRFCAAKSHGVVEFVYGNKIIHKSSKEFLLEDGKIN